MHCRTWQDRYICTSTTYNFLFFKRNLFHTIAVAWQAFHRSNGKTSYNIRSIFYDIHPNAHSVQRVFMTRTFQPLIMTQPASFFLSYKNTVLAPASHSVWTCFDYHMLWSTNWVSVFFYGHEDLYIKLF